MKPDEYIKQLLERIENKNAILKDYYKKLLDKNINENSKTALNEECIKLERAVLELNYCLRLYKDFLKGGLK